MLYLQFIIDKYWQCSTTPSKIIIGIVGSTKEEAKKKLFTAKALSVLTLILPSILKKRDKPTSQQTEEENAKSFFVIH